ncbi:hypothetical protein AMECASPLE_029134 [Ameca splendens]|uniref:Uncharacterized protein n=1 Tax=Ameca splendens TaxID=208324 RepID=A0ABV1ACV2_9TELE
MVKDKDREGTAGKPYALQMRIGLSSAPCAREGLVLVAERRDRERRGREEEEERAGLAGCGLKWQQFPVDHPIPFSSTGKLQLVAYGEVQSRTSSKTSAQGAGVLSDSLVHKNEECRETTTLQLGCQQPHSLSLTLTPTQSTLNLFV